MKSFTLQTHTEPDYAVTDFQWATDGDNNVTLSWTWPENPLVKYMLVGATHDMPADPLQWLMQEPGRHTVVTRNLAAGYQAPIGDKAKRYILAPAYLCEKNIAVYGPAFSTDLLYAKLLVETSTFEKPLTMSRYKRVSFSLAFPTEKSAHWKAALRYTVYEGGRIIGTYPLDEVILAGGCMYIKKNRHVRFSVEDGFTHLMTLV